MKPLILDCDTGEDDALAILVAIVNKLPLELVVTSYGNSTLQNATRNSSRIVSLAQAPQVKILPGMSKQIVPHPLEKTAYSAGDFVGKNGLCNTKLPPSNYKNIIRTKNYVSYLKKYLEETGPVDYIITGPCTNFAKLYQEMGESLKQYIGNLYIMGGALYESGNSGPVDKKTSTQLAEFNFYCDPFAADILLKAGFNVHLVTWDITCKLTIPFKEIQQFKSKTPVGTFVIDLMKNFFSFYGLENDRNFELNDPVTILAYIGIGKFVEKKVKVDITKNVGQLLESKKGSVVKYYMLKNNEEVVKKIKLDILK